MKYRPEIDGLRAIAVVPVIFFHAGFDLFSGGYVGVDVFFVISGYLISSIIVSDLDQNRFTIRKFYERRARRILPALIFVLLCCLPFAWFWMLPAQLAQFGENLIGVSFFVSNIQFWMASGYFAPASELNPLLHTWSLAVEEQFYVFFPIILLLTWRLAPQYLTAMIVAATIASLALAQWAADAAAGANFYLIPTRAWELGFGVLCALWLRKNEQRPNNYLALLGLAGIIASIVMFDEHTPIPSVYGVLPVAGTALIILFAGQDSLVARLLSLRGFVMVGLISYSAYLWHQPIFAFTRIRFGDDVSASVYLALCAAALILGYVSWRFVERPFRAGSASIITRQNTVFGVALAALFGTSVLGAGLAASNGALFRYAPQDREILKSLENPAVGNYVKARFVDHLNKPFDQDGKKVLIIGDSFAQDFVNVLFEGASVPDISLSTHHIPIKCGNLMTDQDLTRYIKSGRQATCAGVDRFVGEGIKRRLAQADYVVLASAWQDWEVTLLAQSLANLQSLSGGKFIVVNRKRFKAINLQDVAQSRGQNRAEIRVPLSAELAALNAAIASSTPNIIDISGAICGAGDTCRLYTAAGELISHDGEHLTRQGARFAAQQLWERSSLFRELVE